MVKFNTLPIRGDRIHYLNPTDIQTLLSRLPAELTCRLRAVHFNDRARGNRTLGYVNRGRREIALCALPPRVSLTRALSFGQKPHHFGAQRGAQWPTLAVRRFMLYDVFLHELGHLQLIDPHRPSEKLRFAKERRAQEFAMEWCEKLWSTPFDHPDPVHNPPAAVEITTARKNERDGSFQSKIVMEPLNL